MTSKPAKAVNPSSLNDKKICLDKAYEQSADQDKEIAAEFDATLADGLVNAQGCLLAVPEEAV